MPHLLTLREAAGLSKYSESHLRKLIRTGQLPAVKRSTLLFVTASDLMKYMEIPSKNQKPKGGRSRPKRLKRKYKKRRKRVDPVRSARAKRIAEREACPRCMRQKALIKWKDQPTYRICRYCATAYEVGDRLTEPLPPDPERIHYLRSSLFYGLIHLIHFKANVHPIRWISPELRLT